ncbi:MAG: Histidinol-phosphatase, partial [uncultured Solirubrobacteraceae bacterium]
ADRLPRPPAPGRAGHPVRAALHRGQRRALPHGGHRAGHRGARRVGARLPLHPGARRLGPRALARERPRRPRRLLRLRPRGDGPAARHRGRLHPGPRGPHGRAARGPAVGLRPGLHPLPRRPSAGLRPLRRVDPCRVGRQGLADLLHLARRGRRERPLRHPGPSRPGQALGARAPVAREGPALLLRAGDGAHRRLGDRGGGLHGRPAQARGRDLPRPPLPGDGRGRGQPHRAELGRAHHGPARPRLRAGARAARRGRRHRARGLRGPPGAPGADRV